MLIEVYSHFPLCQELISDLCEIKCLHLETISDRLLIMNKNTAKTYIRQLVKREGSEKAVSQLLGITPRYVKMLLAGQVPSEPLRKLIKVVLK